MLKQRVIFFSFVFSLIGLLAWLSDRDYWVNQSNGSSSAPSVEMGQENLLQRREAQRSELLETLDRIVVFEHYYRSVHGRFTRLVNRTGLSFSKELSKLYDIRVSQATSDRLLVTAFSEGNGKTEDVASLDENFQLHANFAIPAPREEYLKLTVMKHLRNLLNKNGTKDPISEMTLYKGYFSYEIKEDSKGKKYAFAYGVRKPVEDLKLSYQEGSSDEELTLDEGQLAALSGLIGEDNADNPHSKSCVGDARTSDQLDNCDEVGGDAHLAQEIFRGELGRYAKSWAELSKVAHFRSDAENTIEHHDAIGSDTFSENKLTNRVEITRLPTGISSAAPRPFSPERILSKKGLEIERIR